jgi:gliding motility-associated-like protein
MKINFKKPGGIWLKFFWVVMLFTLFGKQEVSAQLLDFNLDIVATNETCTGNGTLTFSIDNPTPDATILYSVFLLPNESLPIYTSTTPFVESLNAGTYKVIALETLGAESLAVEEEVVIENQIVPLTYTISSVAHNCDVGGEIVITTTSGTAVLYEIISGPQIMPLQESNVFTGMPEGLYNIRVFDLCGQGVVTTYMLELNPALPVVSPPTFAEVLTGDCSSVTITNTISYPEGTAITYPLTIVYTIYPPGGAAPEVVTQFYESGLPDYVEFSHTFPVVEGEGYTYDIEVTNGCGNNFGTQGNIVNPVPAVNMQAIPIPCGHNYLSITVSQFSPPFTMQFTQWPEGFNPEEYNSTYPGPYTEGGVSFGNDETPVAEGTYSVVITDACGRTATGTLEVEDVEVQPAVTGKNNGCFSILGRITASVPDRHIVSAIITAAPDSYTEPLPFNASSFINSAGNLIITNLPIGVYTVVLTDDCGYEYTVDVEVPEFVPGDFSFQAYSDCTPGSGAIRVSSSNGALVSINLVSAPNTYTGNVPQNVSAYINADGKLYMDNLPEGTYIFTGTDVCGIEKTVTAQITPPAASNATFNFVPQCNSWSVTVNDSGAATGVTYWLQKENASQPGQWGHPDTGVAYADGTLPNTTNSFALANGVAQNNLQYFGNFRIIKVLQTVGTGQSSKLCFTNLGAFNYQYGVVVQDVYNAVCLGTSGSVYIDATGLAPLTYRIVEKNGVAFLIDNGTNNIFTNLEPGVYKFEVENACGQTGVAIRNVNQLPNLVDVNFPDDILLCVEPGVSSLQEFNLLDVQQQILGNQSPDVYNVTYYISTADATAETNPIADPQHYNNTSSPQVIYARVEHNYISICYEVVDFSIQVSENPQIDMNPYAAICVEEGQAQLTATAGYDSYQWSTGATTQTITVTEPGDYTVTVTKDYGIGTCSADFTVTVFPSANPSAFSYDLVDWTDNENSITINTYGIGAYEFSLDGINFQSENVFTGLEPGLYTVYVRDTNGCGELTKEVALLNYPRFFSPNGDGINDTWGIEYSWFEPNMMVFVYDRYGKLITSFRGQSIGWDGTLNGQNLPSTDYWFVVNRQDGRVFKGHFSMIR